ncbi:mononuclear molybdenum enzyme YedY [Oleiphilus sp. HI0130]|uniref:protein-methionine-sulfoxide reductase catalytic subunit MsrP n=1 Tax=Oleiphilus sp. HI0079 TaxID=1822254 RepID=UPI0007C26DB2|nr:protein-methionine-sulfoxide reductase catalytic subunit MsrP [Oleiphilus sp. HI0079]KZZ13449.1 mononuclear molybdenum enzyme YedY [Oleiphilus sp. HI0079]KZZ43624.1 mononuclear molybdenum enzyme YedY [Oleiphilus sp. HI0118]KZZ64494.1 mononuclear molybdenum enzyme YedY [Oleiphilus sp. HI0130]
MLIKVKSNSDPLSSEITPESVYLNRRRFLSLGATASVSLSLGGMSSLSTAGPIDPSGFSGLNSTNYAPGEAATPFETASTYNNFYEFGTSKDDPARYANEMTVDPWSVKVEGMAGKTGVFPLEDLIKGLVLEERVYRLRCVEAWSMVIPWVGFPLRDLITRLEPQGSAKYVFFETLNRPSEMRGMRSFSSTIDWPYVEGLRMDEALHPMTMLAVGMYGKELPNQNGAPLRLVVPWKYGFKSIKSISKIRFTDKREKTSWEKAGPSEYGFYSNVNPKVDHPRWSQKTERRLPNTLFSPNRIETRMFNGYAEEVESLYAGMDLKKNF